MLEAKPTSKFSKIEKTVDQLGKSEKDRLINTLTCFRAIEC